MLSNIRIILIVILALCTGSVTAQPAQQAEDWIQLFNNLHEAGNYTYERTGITSQSYRDTEDITLFEQNTETLFTAEVLSPQDYNILSESTMQDGDFEATYTVELLRVEGELFIRLDLRRIYPTAALPEGWWREADLLNLDSDIAWQMMISSMAGVEMPFAFVNDPRLILSITEEEPEIIDGLELQVFTIEIDQLTASFLDSLTSIETALEMIQQDSGLIAASLFELRYKVWLNPQNQQIYRLDKDYSQYIPYADFPETTTPYNLAFSGHSQTTFTYPTERLTIAPPTEAELNQPQ